MAPDNEDTMRQNYRALTPAEQQNMALIKQLGQDLHNYLETLGNSRELSLAKTKVEESVMWGVKHLTG